MKLDNLRTLTLMMKILTLVLTLTLTLILKLMLMLLMMLMLMMALTKQVARSNPTAPAGGKREMSRASDHSPGRCGHLLRHVLSQIDWRKAKKVKIHRIYDEYQKPNSS